VEGAGCGGRWWTRRVDVEKGGDVEGGGRG
jgi:hypothetical protein